MADLDAAIRAKLALDDDRYYGSYYFQYDCEMIQSAVFAVLELHRPIWDGKRCATCVSSVPDCGAEPADWPCDTIEAIAEKLGIQA